MAWRTDIGASVRDNDCAGPVTAGSIRTILQVTRFVKRISLKSRAKFMLQEEGPRRHGKTAFHRVESLR